MALLLSGDVTRRKSEHGGDLRHGYQRPAELASGETVETVSPYPKRA